MRHTIIPNTTTHLQIRQQIPRYLLLASGIIGMVFFTTIDFIRPGVTLKFGTHQLAGFVISTIIVLAGMYTTRSPRAKTWYGILLMIYLTGILYMGLKPYGQNLHDAKGFLITFRPPIYDFLINILGFVPFAYLSMAYLIATNRVARIAIAVLIALAAGMGISFFMEVLQYHIPGRTSSMMDLIANTAGTSIGIAYFVLEKRLRE